MAKFYLIAGHGNGDPGAIGNGQQEYKLARQFNDILAKYLKDLGQTVQVYNSTGSLEGTKDMYQQSLKGQGLYSFKVDDRIVFETHLNGSSDKTAHGTELWIGKGLAADKYDKIISNVLAKYFTQRGIKKSSVLLNMNIAKQRGINYRLIELCFISNKDDVTKLIKEMDNIARDMAEALTGKSLKPRKASEAVGKGRIMGADGKQCWLYLYPWDVVKSRVNTKDKYSWIVEVNTNERAIFNSQTGRRVNTWKGQVTRLMQLDPNIEQKMKRG